MNLLVIIGYFISTVIIVAVIVYAYRRDKAVKLKKLQDGWGKIPDDALDIDSAKLLFLAKAVSSFEGYRIDDQTWNDLNGDETFRIINRTATPTGAQYLYDLLRHPVCDNSVLDARERLISLFSGDARVREKVRIMLRPLADAHSRYLPHSLWKPLPEKPRYARFLPVMSLFSFIVLALAIAHQVHFLAVIAVFAAYLVIRFLIKRGIESHLHAFQYLGVLISAADRISRLHSQELSDIRENLNSNLRHTRPIAGKIYTLHLKDPFGLYEYLNIYFLWDIAGFYSVLDEVNRYRAELKVIFEKVGLLDAAISLASFRHQYPRFCRPVLSAGSRKFETDGIYNPLLASPVPNTFSFDTSSILITGSNMAGKTTFLRTMGINAILAQTVNTCMAERYEAPFVRVLSSITLADSITTGKSYYLAEVESILRLIRASEEDFPHLFILDELFRGTNSVERHAISTEILKFLANEKDYILCATHDLHLAAALEDVYENFHFREEIDDAGLSFSYHIQPGISTTRNAIELLYYAGYPPMLIDRLRQYSGIPLQAREDVSRDGH